MKSGKTIDISKSSLISLKAELSRKQEEVKNIKSAESYIKLPPKPKQIVKKNAGVEERNNKDAELDAEEVDLLKKSKEVLAIKSKLYDEFHKGNHVSKETKNSCLVDFKNKEAPSYSQSCSSGFQTPATSEPDVKVTKVDDFYSDVAETDDDDWVEYTDCLGRTRKCHVSDLAEMRAIDKKVALEINGRPPPTVEKTDEIAQEKPPELLSSDMEREAFRKKWEEQEIDLLKKKDIHYEDILFDEARTHGVGYFKFSQDQEQRHAEQEMLKKVRQETEARQQEARLLRERRETQRQSRLMAARQRQRARLGLPPLSEQEILKDITAASSSKAEEEDNEKEIGLTPVGDLESMLSREAYVRPWDIGKNKIEEPAMSQEEWTEKKRNERISEFGPAYGETMISTYDVTKPPPLIKKRKFEQTSLPKDNPNRREKVTPEEAVEAGLKFIREQVLQQRSTSDK